MSLLADMTGSLLKRSRWLAYAVQPAMVIRRISVLVIFLEAVVLSQVGAYT